MSLLSYKAEFHIINSLQSKILILHYHLFEIYFGEHGTLFSLNDINHINLTYILKDNKNKKVTNIKAENVT